MAWAVSDDLWDSAFTRTVLLVSQYCTAGVIELTFTANVILAAYLQCRYISPKRSPNNQNTRNTLCCVPIVMMVIALLAPPPPPSCSHRHCSPHSSSPSHSLTLLHPTPLSLTLPHPPPLSLTLLTPTPLSLILPHPPPLTLAPLTACHFS